MSNLSRNWAERAGQALAQAEQHKPQGTSYTRPAGWKAGSRYCPGYLREPTGGQLEQSQRATKKSHASVALDRKLDQVLGRETDE